MPDINRMVIETLHGAESGLIIADVHPQGLNVLITSISEQLVERGQTYLGLVGHDDVLSFSRFSTCVRRLDEISSSQAGNALLGVGRTET